MRRFLKHIIFFSLPLLPVIIFVMMRVPEKKFAFHYQPDDCENRCAWLYDRIYNDTTPIDIAFTGSSHTITGIQDAKLESLLMLQGERKYVANLGYCRFGDELPYVLFKDVLSRKHPKTLIIEIREGLTFTSHPVYPFLADNSDLLTPPSIIQPAYFSNVYNGWLQHLGQIRSELFIEKDTVNFPGYIRFGARHSDHIEDSALLESIEQHKKDRRTSDILEGWQAQFPLAWLHQTEQLASMNHCSVYYLYLPGYGSFKQKPELDQGAVNGKILIPPQSIFTDYKNWRDGDHLNDKGALALTQWLSTQIH